MDEIADRVARDRTKPLRRVELADKGSGGDGIPANLLEARDQRPGRHLGCS